jgi:HK97 family phage major capsid protein
MSDDIKSAIDAGVAGLQAKLDTAIERYEGQVKEAGKASEEAKSEVQKLSGDFMALRERMVELQQKGEQLNEPAAPTTWGQQFIRSDEFKSLAANPRSRNIVNVEVKNTVSSDSTTVFPFQKPGIISGDFAPLTLRQILRSVPVTSNAVNALREDTWVNSAAEVTQGAAKNESDITFTQYNVPIQTVAHWIKVTNQLLADAPAVAAYIDTRLRDGLAQRVDYQLLRGDGTSPALSGLTDSGNFTAYTPTSDDTLVDAINRAKYQLWAIGHMPDVAIVNPADWGAMERSREGVGSGAYLYGMPGVAAGVNPFGVRIVLSNHMPAGKFLIAALNTAAVLYDRQSVSVEMGYVNDDFTKNLVTIRAEERLALAVERPTASLYGDFAAGGGGGGGGGQQINFDD